jgi:hypothetical protein
MTETNCTPSVEQSQTTTPQTLADVPLYAVASPEHQRLLQQDMAHAVDGDGLPLAEYLDGLLTWGGDAASYLAESGLLPTPAPADQAAAQTAEQAKAAAEQAEQHEDLVRREAVALLAECVKTYRQGEKAYRQGLLQAGRLADEYLELRMTLGDKRAAAVQTLEGQLAMWSSATVDVNRLVSCWQAFRLLAEEPGLAKATAKGKAAPADAVPYGHYRDCWSRLVERQNKDTTAECWVLLPGLETECRAAFAKAVQDGLSKAAVEDAVRLLVQDYAARQAKATAEAKAAAAAKAAAEQAAAQQASAELLQAQAEMAKAQQAVTSAKASEQAAYQAVAEKAAEELLAKQRAAVQASAAAEQAAREKAKAEAAAKTAEEARVKAAAKADKTAKKATEKTPPVPPTIPPQTATLAPATTPATATKPVTPLLPTRAEDTDDEEQWSADEAALEACEVLVSCDAPDDAVLSLLTLLADNGELSRKTQRALKAAVVLLKRAESPSPAEVAAALNPSANGTPAAAPAA